jgi:SAM-dependent methyltransferase
MRTDNGWYARSVDCTGYPFRTARDGDSTIMKALIRKLIPDLVRDGYRRFIRLREQRKNRTKTIEEVFTDIYRRNIWGGAKGEFRSGSGSTNERVVSSYISLISEKAVSEGFWGLTFVDLGCGDFRVGRRLLPYCSRYIGVDIVEPLIVRNQQEFGGATTHFMHLNVVDDSLPDGEVCFVRQVLQHLSNEQICAVLSKLDRYDWVFITEHYPTDNPAIEPNRDKVHGGDIRLYENSGVYLAQPPFNLPEQRMSMALEISSDGLLGEDAGVIRTFLYKPNR